MNLFRLCDFLHEKHISVHLYCGCEIFTSRNTYTLNSFTDEKSMESKPTRRLTE